MAENNDILRRQLEAIRDERATSANTATRIGNALLALLSEADVAIQIAKEAKESAGGAVDLGEELLKMFVKKTGDVMAGDLSLEDGAKLKIGDAYISWDEENKCIRISKGLYSDQFISAFGTSDTTASGGGSSSGAGVDLLQAWSTMLSDDDARTRFALSAFLGKELNDRLEKIESGALLKIITQGEGEVVTDITPEGNTLVVNKDATKPTVASLPDIDEIFKLNQ